MRSVRRKFLSHRGGVISAAFIVLLVLMAAFAPFLMPADPSALSDDVMAPPSAAHMLGTDGLGRDVLSGLIEGVRVSLAVGFFAALAASIIGVLIGALSGYAGGWFDDIVMRVSEVFQVVPAFILAAVIVAMSGPGMTQIIAVIAVLAWPQIARVMRGEVIRVKNLEFVDAARCLGFGNRFILFAEILPNAVAPVLAAGTLIVGQAILLEVSLSFLGLSGVDVMSWGRMLNSGQRFLFEAWWLSVFPGTAIFLTVLAFNLLGDALGIALNPRSAR